MNVVKILAAIKMLQEAVNDTGSASAAPVAPAAAPEAKVSVNPDWFREICLVLGKVPDGAIEADKLASLQEGLKRYGSLTAKQWRMFSAIHNKLLGAWPDQNSKPAPSAPSGPVDLTEVPF